ncbi:MAG: triose-phosphate isomerase [Candidatus Latescibacteria bacterium]|nr:triose-phosphate isomerase [bacterium]MBD3423368.1 triose-phosphate isomerase [Candidatus Latescibacterota bacterium]
MRSIIVAGNWKMNMDPQSGARLAAGILKGLEKKPAGCVVILFPPSVTIPAVVETVEGSQIGVGGQNLYFEESGAFTGEISAGMLKGAGCGYVLVGHSERRHIFGEDSELLARKLRAALDSGLAPVLCVGELLDQRESGDAEKVVRDQLGGVLEGIDDRELTRVMIAYEPVWAIGTGKTATPEDAASMHAVIREWISSSFGDDAAEEMTIMYGGSVKPHNAATLLSEQEIDGALVGGASLEAASFLDIIRSV